MIGDILGYLLIIGAVVMILINVIGFFGIFK